MTTYVVLQRHAEGKGYWIVAEPEMEANNAEQACRRVAEAMAESAVNDGDTDPLAAGIELIAIPARNWTSGRHTLKAETTRRIRSA